MIGRRVRSVWGEHGVVVDWQPLGSALTDTLIELENGYRCWYAATDLRPADDQGPLPERRAAQREAASAALKHLRGIREQLIRDFRKPWPGCEFAKTLVGRAIDSAIKELEDL
jgi:hypothetical protein